MKNCLKISFLAVAIILLCSCTVMDKRINLIDDRNFLTGFSVRGLSTTESPGEIGTYTYAGSTKTPQWEIAQWWSGHNLLDGTKEDLGNGVYKISDNTKAVTVDTKNASITTAVSTSGYGGGNWTHLLISQPLAEKYAYSGKEYLAPYKVSDAASILFTCKLSMQKESVEGGVSQYIIYLYCQNLNTESPDFGNLFYFGLPIYDSRNTITFIPEYTAQDFADTSGFFIYNLSNRRFFSEPFNTEGGIYSIHIDLFNDISEAFKMAKSKGYFPNSTFNDIYISSLVTGWEVPGNAQGEITMTDLGIYIAK